MNTRTRATPFLFVTPSLLVLLAFGIYPLVYTIRLSFQTWLLFRPNEPPSPAGVANFARLLADSQFGKSLLTTVVFMGITLSAEFILGFAVALLLNVIVKWRKVFRTVAMVPMTLSAIVAAVIWRLLYNPDFGLLNYFFQLLLGKRFFVNWLGDPHVALISICITDIWQWTPFVIVIVLAGLQSLPVEPYESAVVDGASGFQRLVYLTIPMMRTTILITLLLRGMDLINEFDKIFGMTFGGPGYKTQVVGLYLYRVGFRFYDMGYLAALSLMVLIFVMVITQILIRLIRR